MVGRSHLIFFVFVFSFGLRTSSASSDDSLSATQSSRFLVFPFAIKSPETRWGLGLATAFFFKASGKQPDLRTSDISLISLFTQRKQIILVTNASVFTSHENFIFRFQGSYSYYPDKTWGIGNTSPESNRENYSYRQMYFNPQVLRRVAGNLYVGASLETQHFFEFTYSKGGVFDVQEIPGREGGQTSGAGALLTWDRRNNAYSPSHGFFAEVNYTSFGKAMGGEYDFNSLSLDVRKFFPWRRNSVLALQAVVKLDQGRAPVRNLAKLGGPELMRGYFQGRYMDLSMAAAQAEWRQYLVWRLGVVGFVSAGEVGPHFSSYSLPGIHYAYGAGIRIMMKEKEKVNLRIDYGRGENSSGLYVMIKEAF